MLKLLRAYFSRLGKWTIFRILALLMLVGGAGAALILRGKPMVFQLPYVASYILFPHYVGIIIALFNYPLFTGGTIRNQLSVGHKRSSVYIADWAASVAFSVSLYLIMTLSLTAVSVLFGNTDGIIAKNVAEGIVLTTCHVTLFATISQVFCVIFKGVKSFLAIYLGNQAFVLLGVFLPTIDNFPQKLGYFLPTFVCMNIKNYGIPDAIITNGMVADYSFLPALGVMILETVLVFICGLLYFRKTDLK